MTFKANRNLYLAADKKTVVEESDPRQAWVLVGKGGTLSDEDAKKYGLSNEAEAANPQPPAAGEPKAVQQLTADAPRTEHPPTGEPAGTATQPNVSGVVKTEEPPKTIGSVSPGAPAGAGAPNIQPFGSETK